MRGYNLFAVILFLLILNTVSATYWFQFGARGGIDSAFNNGTAITIKTIIPQNTNGGSLAFWVGENLQNGAFLQVGYLITNTTANYPLLCDLSECTTQIINAGQAEWFYEYFPASNANASFLGAIGPQGSAGANGTSNTYSFYSTGTTWHILVNGQEKGTADLGSATSGPSIPVAFGELANSTGITPYIQPVTFYNLSYYKNGRFKPAATGYSYIGFGAQGERNIQDPYGVQEYDSRTNYFMVGSGLSRPIDGTQLWSLGYSLDIVSKYAGIGGLFGYVAYTRVPISVPEYIYINNYTREKFTGWTGTGYGSYTGSSNYTVIRMDSNITEVATWTTQYFVNVTTPYGNTTGTGWYDAHSNAQFGVSPTTIYHNHTYRSVFANWSMGSPSTQSSIVVNSPANITALWDDQYFVNVTTPYGNTTGTGWYINNTYAHVSVYPNTTTITPNKKYSFFSWSNGIKNSSANVLVKNPIELNAQFRNEYLVPILLKDAYGNVLTPTSLVINNKPSPTENFLFEGVTYLINGAYYKNTFMASNNNETISDNSTIYINLPIYNVKVTTRDIFDLPVNASLDLNFSNGTDIHMYSGSSGIVNFNDVPYGEISGKATYLGITMPVKASGGSNASIIFISITDIIIFVVVIILGVLAHEISKRRLRGTSQTQ